MARIVVAEVTLRCSCGEVVRCAFVHPGEVAEKVKRCSCGRELRVKIEVEEVEQ